MAISRQGEARVLSYGRASIGAAYAGTAPVFMRIVRWELVNPGDFLKVGRLYSFYGYIWRFVGPPNGRDYQLLSTGQKSTYFPGTLGSAKDWWEKVRAE